MKTKVGVFFAFLAAIFLIVTPAFGGWGAGWSTGSVIGKGTVDVAASTVKADVAQFGCRNFHDPDDCQDDPDHAAPLLRSKISNVPSTQGNGIVGVIFCQTSGDDDRKAGEGGTRTFESTVHVTYPLNFTGSDTPNSGGGFTIHAQPDQTSLNKVFDAKKVCVAPSGGGHHDDGRSGSHGNVTIVDFVPQQFSTRLAVYDAWGHFIKQKVYDCTISWSTLGSLRYQEQKPYTCQSH